MFFKNASIYLLPDGWQPTIDMAKKLEQAAFAPCVGLDWFQRGFVPPTPFIPQEMVFVAQNTWRVALKKEEKVLPAAVVRDILDEKVQEIQNAEGRNVGRKEKQELKDNITDDLLPRAFTKSSRIEALMDTDHGLLLVNNANANKAEILLGKLREALGGLEAWLPRTQQSPGSLMTDWLLRGAGEGGFELDSDCELKGLGDAAATVCMSKQDLSAEEVINHVQNGKVVTQLGLCWQERVRFVLTQDFTLKRIQFLDVLQEEADKSGDDRLSLMFASQIIMANALCGMINELAKLLGGWIDE